MDYEKAYRELGFSPNQHAVVPDGNRQSLEASNFAVFSLVKHLPERLVTSTAAAPQKQSNF